MHLTCSDPNFGAQVCTSCSFSAQGPGTPGQSAGDCRVSLAPINCNVITEHPGTWDPKDLGSDSTRVIFTIESIS